MPTTADLLGLNFKLWELASIVLGVLLSYSYRFNPRLIESATYTLWNTVLYRLVSDRVYMSVTPQFEIYISPLDATQELAFSAGADTSIRTQPDSVSYPGSVVSVS
ncbi:hypothetical protein K466DRAFT_604215 [Polyporus arcularius HHB13444]|uniref:Uncharacterized protein n=1 Tax=Polyporus arcularius HHB13444 TaxID=1314778 RepID=A0A5C3NYD1_9APHY|nr:hypothetical protein K466DRAFT_604215 [Polyporus arcularius HHB13444]